MGRGGSGESEGRSEGAELEGENKWGGGVTLPHWRGYFTTLEGLVGIGEQCSKVTLPRTAPLTPSLHS
jgi:hypothetical protein